MRRFAVALVLLAACSKPQLEADAARPIPIEASAPAVTANLDAGEADASVIADEKLEEMPIIRPSIWDYPEAWKRVFEKMPQTSETPLAGAIVLCRVNLIEPAPKPTSAWDRANGRDLLLETFIDGTSTHRLMAPLGQPSFLARVEGDVQAAAAGQPVRWVLHDRDQAKSAYPYVQSIEIGSVDVPKGVTAPSLSTKTMNVACRAAPLAFATSALLPEADRALATAETGMEWSPADPREPAELREVLSKAGDLVRLGTAIEPTAAWKERAERIRAMIHKHRVSEAKWLADTEGVPVGTWAPVGAKISARVTATICPAVPEGQDPGSLNPEQRTACGLAIELKSVAGAKVEWDADPLGPAYACRDTGLLDITSLRGPGETTHVCTVGFRRGAAGWKKKIVTLSPDVATVAIVGPADALARILRLKFGDAAAYFVVPSSH